MGGAGERPTTRGADDAIERVVLLRVLDLHPARVSPDELAREICGERGDFSERDAVTRAIRDLAGAGLLHGEGGLVSPTRAALRFDELLECD